MFRLECRTVDREVTALGWAGPDTVVIDRPVEGGGGDPPADLDALVRHVDAIAEIPNATGRVRPVSRRLRSGSGSQPLR